jgi:excisionase family DNA binding protein
VQSSRPSKKEALSRKRAQENHVQQTQTAGGATNRAEDTAEHRLVSKEADFSLSRWSVSAPGWCAEQDAITEAGRAIGEERWLRMSTETNRNRKPAHDAGFSLLEETMENATGAPLAVSKRNAANTLGCCERTINYLLAEKKLATVRVGARVLVSVESLKAFVRSGGDSTPLAPREAR